MMDILRLENEIGSAANQLLSDGNWKYAIFYDLSTDSVFWNRAALVSLPKTFASTAPVALIYLLQKEAHSLSLWQQQWTDKTPSLSDFINTIISGRRFSNISGEAVSTEIFWKEFNGTVEAIIEETGFEFSIDEQPATYSNMLEKEDIESIICFDNTWQEQNYLVETSTHWILYHWASAA